MPLLRDLENDVSDKSKRDFDMPFSQSRQSIFIISLMFAAISWLGESLIHFYILNHGQAFELIPGDFNELWMRAVIFSLIVIFGIYAQRHANKKIDVEEAKMRTLKATMNTVEDRVGNALAGIKLLLVGAEESNFVNKETYQKLIILIDETFEDLRKLSSIEKINEKKRLKDIYYLEIENK